jgi:hypothetical protein
MTGHSPQGTFPATPTGPKKTILVRLKLAANWVVWQCTRRSTSFWDLHYRAHGTSGPGSRGEAAEIKAREINRIVEAYGVESVIEFGCGDGYQLGKLSIPEYIGLDVSPTALGMCIGAYGSDPTKTFLRYDQGAWKDNLRIVHADMAMSVDVIFHLVEDEIFERYMEDLFSCADRFVLIYATDGPRPVREPKFTRHRSFSAWVAAHMPEWEPAEHLVNPAETGADLKLYTRRADSASTV